MSPHDMPGRWQSIQQNRYVVVFIIYLAFFLDNMLLTVVVPIIPDFLHTTSLALIPKSAFYDNIESFWPNTEAPPANEKSIQQYQTRNISVINNLKVTNLPSKTKRLDKNIDIKSEDLINRDLEDTKRLSGPVESNYPKKASKTEGIKSDDVKQKQIDARTKYLLDKDIEDIERENGPVGVLLSSKALVQLFLNPLVGIWTSRVGYKVPIFFGSVNLLIASLLFAYGESYLAMLLARSIQGICSACIGVSGMCLAAETFRDERERSRVMGALLGGAALGVLVGYPFGGFLYEFVSKTAPFLVIAAMVFVTLILQLIFMDFNSSFETIEPQRSIAWMPLLTDSVIIIATGAIFISTSAMAILEPCLPIWLMTHLKPEKWQVGTVFVPDSLGYLLGTNLFGAVACRVGQWRVSVTALLTIGVAAFIIPSATSLGQLLLPHFSLGLGIGALDAALVPALATLVDTRHAACYGAVFSLQQTAVSLAYSVAPLVGGALARSVGFAWTLRGLGLLNALYSPLLAALAWKLNSGIQSTRLLDSHSSDCENLNQAINMATYGSTFE